MNMKYKPAEEWLLQADYDMETAQAMFDSGRYIYAMFNDSSFNWKSA